MSQQAYIPSLTFRRLTPLYDTVLGRLFPEAEIKRQVVARIAAPEQSVLDLAAAPGRWSLCSARRSRVVSLPELTLTMKCWSGQKTRLESGSVVAIMQGNAIMLPLADRPTSTRRRR